MKELRREEADLVELDVVRRGNGVCKTHKHSRSIVLFVLRAVQVAMRAR